MPRKSVRFSLRPGAVNTATTDESSSPATPLTASNKAESPAVPTKSKLTPKRRGRPPASASSAAVAAKKENVSDSLDKSVDEFSRALQEEEQAETSLKNSIPKRIVKTSDLTSESPSQMQIVNDILKKNPDLLKDNKVIKLFVA